MDAPETPDSITKRKDEVRARMRVLLSALSESDRVACSAAACSRVLASQAFRSAGTVLVYMPMRSEVDITTVVLEAFRCGKSVCVPRVPEGGRLMNAVEITSIDDETMASDALGVRVPRGGREVVADSIDLVIAPGVAFDLRCQRLGRGGGYYDRFLAKMPRSTTLLGICFDCQLVDSIPAQEADIPVHAVITDRRLIERSPQRSPNEPHTQRKHP